MSTFDDLANALEIKKLIELLRVSETAERYEDMCKCVKTLVELKSKKGEDLDVDERNLFSVAYKNVVGAKRASWRTLSGGFDDANEDLLNNYKNIVENELEAICQQVLKLLTDHLCKNVKDNADETEVFYLKMCGDYYRYLSEFKTDEQNYKKCAGECYQKAMNIAEANLIASHPTRLGLALNFSVYYYEILKEPEKACDLAKKAFDAAIDKLETLNDENSKDSTLIMQLLRDNLTLWMSSNDDTSDNEGIDFSKYGKTAQAKRHDPNNNDDMHELKADLKKLGLMPQNKIEPDNPMDIIRNNLSEIFVEISDNVIESTDGLYKDVIDLILQYEAYIDLSRFKCIQCTQYFGTDIFDFMCSTCYVNKYGEVMMRAQCKNNRENIAIRIEWDNVAAKQRYYNVISMPSLCSIKMYFRILSRSSYCGKYLDVLDENYMEVYSIEKYDSFKKDDDVNDEQVNQKIKLNKRCVSDFGIIALSAILLRY